MGETKSVLVAFDGSDQCLEAVRYVGGAFPADRTEIVFYNVSIEVPESFLDLRTDPGFRSKIISAGNWSNQLKKNTEAAMEKACDLLFDAGFKPNAVKREIVSRKVGIARDILKRANEGFSAVVVGRTGMSKVKDVILGSIANKLIGKLAQVPLIVVGGSPSPGKYLIAFDGSESSMKGVGALADLVVKENALACLCHVIRHLNIHLGAWRAFGAETEAEWIESSSREIAPLMATAKDRLVKAGFSRERVLTEIQSEKTSRAAELVRIAESSDFGGIVVGRRGVTFVEDFVLGRVSTKVLNLAKESAVWVV